MIVAHKKEIKKIHRFGPLKFKDLPIVFYCSDFIKTSFIMAFV